LDLRTSASLSAASRTLVRSRTAYRPDPCPLISTATKTNPEPSP
jgi:hypothetical protein